MLWELPIRIIPDTVPEDVEYPIEDATPTSAAIDPMEIMMMQPNDHPDYSNTRIWFKNGIMIPVFVNYEILLDAWLRVKNETVMPFVGSDEEISPECN